MTDRPDERYADPVLPDDDDLLDERSRLRVEPLRPRWVRDAPFTTPSDYYRDDEPGRRATWEQELLDNEWLQWTTETPLSVADLTDLPPGQKYRASKEDR